MSKAQVIAVTGATGFVGQSLVPKLLEQGHSLRLLVRNPQKMPSDWAAHPQITVVKGDLNADVSDLMAGADCLIHMAGLIKARTRADFMAINANGASHVAKAAQAAGVKRLILLSSMSARAPKLSDYAASKRAGEDAAFRAFGAPITIIRAPAVFGPGDQATKPIFDLLKRGILPVAAGNWRDVRLAMIYDADLSDFIHHQITAPIPNRPLEPATVAAMSWNEFAEICETALNRRVRVVPLPGLALIPVAAITTVTSRLFGLGHLTLGKLREFRHPDWTSADEVDNPTPMIEAIRHTVASYES